MHNPTHTRVRPTATLVALVAGTVVACTSCSPSSPAPGDVRNETSDSNMVREEADIGDVSDSESADIESDIGSDIEGDAGDAQTGDRDGQSRSDISEREIPSEPAFERKIDLGGPTGAIAVGDLNDDGHRDIAALVNERVAREESCSGDLPPTKIVVAWGARQQPWSETWRTEIANGDDNHSDVLQPGSDRTVRIEDVDGDGIDDLVTASGYALGQTSKSPNWQRFPDAAQHLGLPVALRERPNSSDLEIVRGSDGGLERCSVDGADCKSWVQWDAISDSVITSLAVGNFDRDDRRDFVFSPTRYVGTNQQAGLVTTQGDESNVQSLDGVGTGLILAADLDGDGFDDLVSQKEERTQDLPSRDQKLWLNGEGTFPSSPQQHFYTAANHSQIADLGDINLDGCPDYLQADIDRKFVYYLLGTCEGRFRGADGETGSDPNWTKLDLNPGDVGDDRPNHTDWVQWLDVDANDRAELVVAGADRREGIEHCHGGFLYIYSL